MRVLRGTVSAVLFVFATTGLFAARDDDFRDPSPEELAMKGVPFAPGASAAVLDWEYRHDDELSFSTEYIRLKIFTHEGKKYGDIELPYLRGYSSIRDLKARTIRPDGTSVPFTGKPFEKLLIKAGGVKLMQKTFTMPEVQPGSILEYRYKRTWPSNELMPTTWFAQREVPVLRARLWLRPWGRTYSNFFSYSGLPPGKAPTKVGDHFELELNDVPAFEKEPFAPPDDQLKPRVQFYYMLGPVDADKYWTDTGKVWSDFVEDFIGDRSGIRKAAQQTAGSGSAAEKLQRVYARVQQIRNLSYEADKTTQEEKREKLRDNRHIEDVLRNGYGYRSEINRLFVGLARGAGFDASVVRVAQRDELFFARQIPDASQLGGEIALVVIDGQPHYFDPGTPFAPYGLLSWENSAVPGMRLARKTGGAWVETPEDPPTAAVTRRKADLRLDGDVLRGHVTVKFSGQEALVRRLGGMTEDESANRKRIEDEVKNWFPDGSTVKLTGLTGLKSSEEPVVADFDVELANLASSAGSRFLTPVSVFAASQKNPFPAEQRKHGIYFSYPYQVEDEVVLQLPEGYQVESLPKKLTMQLGGTGYKTDVSQTDRSITFTRELFVRSNLIGAEYYKTVRSFFGRVADADQEPLVLKLGATKGAAK